MPAGEGAGVRARRIILVFPLAGLASSLLFAAGAKIGFLLLSQHCKVGFSFFFLKARQKQQAR